MSKTPSPSSRTRNLVEFVEKANIPLSLHDSVTTTEDGNLEFTRRNSLDMAVQYYGYWFGIHANNNGTASTLNIHAVLGHLPYSSENAFLRVNTMAVVRAASRVLAATFKVDDKQNIIVMDRIKVDGHLTPKMILTETTKVILQIKPYLELLSTMQMR